MCRAPLDIERACYRAGVLSSGAHGASSYTCHRVMFDSKHDSMPHCEPRLDSEHARYRGGLSIEVPRPPRCQTGRIRVRREFGSGANVGASSGANLGTCGIRIRADCGGELRCEFGSGASAGASSGASFGTDQIRVRGECRGDLRCSTNSVPGRVGARVNAGENAGAISGVDPGTVRIRVRWGECRGELQGYR